MNTKTIVIVGVVVVAVGAFALSSRTSAPAPESMEKDTMSATEPTPGSSDTMMADSRYVTYSERAFADATGKKRVLFFHAPWCPTCRPADAEFQAKAAEIPEDVILFKTDYDSSTALKKKYGITYQHTYVLVDDKGNEVKKWNGGALAELIAQTK